MKTPAAKKAQARGRTRSPSQPKKKSLQEKAPPKGKAKVRKPSASPAPKARSSSKTPAGRRKTPSTKTKGKRGYIENDIVQDRPADHPTVSGDVRAWNADEDPVHTRKSAAKKPRASSRKR